MVLCVTVYDAFSQAILTEAGYAAAVYATFIPSFYPLFCSMLFRFLLFLTIIDDAQRIAFIVIIFSVIAQTYKIYKLCEIKKGKLVSSFQ